MSRYSLLAYLLSIIIIGLLVVWGWAWGLEYEEYKAVEILASREIDLGVAVYAQFSLSQEFEVQPAAEVKKLVLPMYVQDDTRSILVTLMTEGENIAVWDLGSDEARVKEAGIYEIALMLTEPIIMAGSYKIVINGRDISYEDKDKAPRVFIEKDDSKYEAGNYWIAGNKKAGDMSMQVIGQRTRWHRLKNKWRLDPLQGVITVSSWLLLALVISVGPHVLLRWTGGRAN